MGILYYRDMSTVVPDTSSFSPVTSSRHWMAGLVASGTILLFYLVANWLLGRLAAEYHPLAWWRVWASTRLRQSLVMWRTTSPAKAA